MKIKILIGIFVLCIALILVLVGFDIGYKAGVDSSNLDVVYAQYLNDILPDNVNDTSLIIYERHLLSDGNYTDDYYVYHNCNRSEYWNAVKQWVFYYDVTFSHFNGMGIWNKRL
jgi:hypothetical protein